MLSIYSEDTHPTMNMQARGVSTSRHRPQQVVVRDLIGGASPWPGTAHGQGSGPSGRLAPVAGRRATPGIESGAG